MHCPEGLYHQSGLSIVVITMCYLIFAAQVYYQTDWGRTNRRRAVAVISLIAVFVLCGVSGYLSSLWKATEARWFVRELLHWLLAFASVTLVLTNQARVFSRMLHEFDHELDR